MRMVDDSAAEKTTIVITSHHTAKNTDGTSDNYGNNGNDFSTHRENKS